MEIIVNVRGEIQIWNHITEQIDVNCIKVIV